MQTRRANLNIGDEPIRDIRFTWGGDYPKGRRHIEGWGTAVEVPAVLALLDKIVASELTAGQARELLAGLAEKVVLACDPEEADPVKRAAARCFGDCDECRPNCVNIARTDRDIEHVHVQIERLRPLVDDPLAPAFRHAREQHELDRLERIVTAHDHTGEPHDGH